MKRFFDILGIVGFLFAVPTGLLICGLREPALFLERSLGPLGSPPALLLAFMGLSLLRMLFGSSLRALPLVSGLFTGLFCFAAIFQIPGLSFVREAACRFPAFAEPGPAYFGGLAAILAGSLIAQVESRLGPWKLLAPVGLALALILGLAAWRPFPAVEPERLSLETAFRAIAETLGREYRDPAVEKAVRSVLEDKEKTEAEKEATIAELRARLEKSERDRLALERSAEDARRLGTELDAARRSLEELTGRLDDSVPLLAGGSYAEAVRPMDPAVRDFAVGIALRQPGAFDAPQGSRQPSDAGLRQLVLVHGAIAGSWKYVSDPAGSWKDYVSPARRSLALGLAGDCDDFAVVVASCVAAIGGRVRIMHGYNGRSGHAWAELMLGDGPAARIALDRLAGITGRTASSLATDRDADGTTWLVLDWRLGELSITADRLEVSWTGEP